MSDLDCFYRLDELRRLSPEALRDLGNAPAGAPPCLPRGL